MPMMWQSMLAGPLHFLKQQLDEHLRTRMQERDEQAERLQKWIAEVVQSYSEVLANLVQHEKEEFRRFCQQEGAKQAAKSMQEVDVLTKKVQQRLREDEDLMQQLGESKKQLAEEARQLDEKRKRLQQMEVSRLQHDQRAKEHWQLEQQQSAVKELEESPQSTD
jgi:hypothetical protein